MAGTLAGAEKRRQTLIARYGSEEAYKEVQREAAQKGGSTRKTKPHGFAYLAIHDPNKLREISKKGGRESTRPIRRVK